MKTWTNRWQSLLLGSAMAAVMTLGSVGCAAWLPDDEEKLTAKEEEYARRDRWNWQNNPNRFGGTMVTQLSQLPMQGRAARAAWPSSYWPTYKDSINARWRGADELSPAEK